MSDITSTAAVSAQRSGMVQRTIAFLILGLTLPSSAEAAGCDLGQATFRLPSSAEAAGCDLGQATFRPKYAAEDFVLRSYRNKDELLFDIAVRRSGETFRFRVDVDERTAEGLIASMPDGGGRDPGVKTTFALVDADGLKATTPREVGYIAFLDIGRAFLDFRSREGQQPDPYTTPPSGLWEVAECRGN
jgi:hypothetical protein